MYAARRNRNRLRVTLTLMIASMVLGAMLSLEIANQQIASLNEARRNSTQTGETLDWVETLSALGEEVIQLFISMTSETR